MNQPPRKSGRRWRKALAVGGAALLALVLISWLAATPLLRRELVALVQERLKAKLTMGEFSYSFPYGLVARDCKLEFAAADGQAVELLQAGELSVTLARLPLSGGPLVIQDITVRQPTVHLINAAGGLVHPAGSSAGAVSAQSGPPPKLSDILRLRHLEIDGGTVVYEDRTRADFPPLLWQGIDVHLEASPNGAADYNFTVAVKHGDVADFQADGAFNVDDFFASLKHFDLEARAGTAGQNGLPPRLQQLLQQHQVKGTLKIQGTAYASAGDPSKDTCSADISLKNASAFSPEFNVPLDSTQLMIHLAIDSHGASASMANFSARSGGIDLAIQDGSTITIDNDHHVWSLQKFAGELKNNGYLPVNGGPPVQASASPNQTASSVPNALPTGRIDFTANMNGPLVGSFQKSNAQGQLALDLHDFSMRSADARAPDSSIDSHLTRSSTRPVDDRLNARLMLAGMSFLPPVGLDVKDCQLSFQTIDGQTIDLFQARELAVTLADLWPKDGPMVIQNITARAPTMHLVQTPGGIVLPVIPRDSLDSATSGKIFDSVRLLHLAIDGGTVVYENRASPDSSSSRIWKGIAVDLTTSHPAQGDSDLEYALVVKSGDSANIQAAGSLTQNPNDVITTLSGFQAHGGGATLSLANGAVFDLDTANKSWSASKLAGQLTAASAAPKPGGRGPALIGDPDTVHTVLASLAMSGSIEFTADLRAPFSKSLNGQDITGQLSIIPHDFSISPPGFESPISHINADPIQLVSGGAVAIKNLHAQYGDDPILVATAQVSLASLSRRIVPLTGLNATIDFHASSPPYPQPLGDAFSRLRPGGEYRIDGWATLDAGGPALKEDYDLGIHSDHGSLQLVAQGLNLTQVILVAELVPDHLQIVRMLCNTLGGKLNIVGQVNAASPNPYSAIIVSQGLRLEQISDWMKLSKNGKPQFKGLLDARVDVHGSGPTGGKTAEQLLVADGQVEISQGDLWDMPVLQGIYELASIARDALTVGQAAARFHVENRIITLRNAAVSSPLLGVQGTGNVDFDGNLDLRVVAAPLADLKKQIQGTGIPIISNVVGDIAGGIQKIFREASSKLIYQIHITGPASNPQVKTEPVPLITDTVSKVFANMLKQNDKSPPIDLLDEGK